MINKFFYMFCFLMFVLFSDIVFSKDNALVGRFENSVLDGSYHELYDATDLKSIYKLVDCKSVDYECISDYISQSIFYLDSNDPKSLLLSINNLKYAAVFFSDYKDCCPLYFDYASLLLLKKNLHEYPGRFLLKNMKYKAWAKGRGLVYMYGNDGSYEYCSIYKDKIIEIYKHEYCLIYECKMDHE
ncbi:hypothetical protein SAMN03080615_01262 [Amphritea atlantica]|uniref:Uncharacterized protein n=1 Tax=Amphritea atlantica TaxID=355243 RepID=A0A1H9FIH4_9GAMM|nr:hypothetical protein [Amphritea atlantica]SEQ37303.1 hypothetical protein SAMN03080615_01262 [Amphritea atlantica]